MRCPDDIDEPQIGENIVIYNLYDDIKARCEVERFYLRPRGDRNSGHKNVSTTIGLMVLNCEMSSYLPFTHIVLMNATFLSAM